MLRKRKKIINDLDLKNTKIKHYQAQKKEVIKLLMKSEMQKINPSKKACLLC